VLEKSSGVSFSKQNMEKFHLRKYPQTVFEVQHNDTTNSVLYVLLCGDT